MKLKIRNLIPQRPSRRQDGVHDAPNSSSEHLPAAQAGYDEALAEEVRRAFRDAKTLPTLPDVALKIRTEVRRENADVDSVAQVIAQDPAIASSLMKIVNAPLHRMLVPVKDLRTAVARLGLESAANLVVTLALRGTFAARYVSVREAMGTLRDESTEVGIAAWCLAHRVQPLLSDQAMLAGLVHRIGYLPVLMYFDQEHTAHTHLPQRQALATALHAELGEQLLKRWGFPRTLYEIPRRFDAATFNKSQPLPWLVRAARLLSVDFTESMAQTPPAALWTDALAAQDILALREQIQQSRENLL